MESLLTWLRTNLAVAAFLATLVSGACGALITTSVFIGNIKTLIAERGRMLASDDRQLEGLHHDMVNVDRRLNDQSAYIAELRRTRDGQVAVLEQRIAVLEAQLRFLADRTPVPQPLGSHR